MTRSRLVLSAGLLLVVPTGSAAQDVELLGRVHGTRPPAGYYDTRGRHPAAFEFARGWIRRARMALHPTLAPSLAPGSDASPSGTPLGARGSALTGTVAFPLLLGLYSDSPQTPPYDRAAVEDRFFEGPHPDGTITDYYAEVSGGRLEMVGAVEPWHRTTLSATEVAGGSSGLGPGNRVGPYVMELLAEADARGVDWGRFDNDGPDGEPNSGDDDGFVDILAVMHPTSGAECGGGGQDHRVWSHRWNLQGATGQVFVTSTASAAPDAERIVVDDYTIQPVLNCDGAEINDIGVFAHELGHGLGLPDLYSTGQSDHSGAGNWDLMGTGAWGCRGDDAARPCHPGAWTKAVLGWVDVVELEPGEDLGTLELDPVESSGVVYRMESLDGSGDYVLLENRQALGYDDDLYAEGLLVWQVDTELVETRWPANAVNSTPDRLGVWLRQADGRNDLARSGGGRGDAGDPFPGSTANAAFHAGSTPGAWSHLDAPTGLTLLDIAPAGDRMRARVLTRYQRLRIRIEGTEGTDGLVTVLGNGAPDGAFVPGTVVAQSSAGPAASALPAGRGASFASTAHVASMSEAGAAAAPGDLVVDAAPFQELLLEASPGEPLGDGVRRGFEGWEDDAPRVRSFRMPLDDVTLVARYGGPPEYEVRMELTSPAEGVEPGEVQTFPASEDGWFDDGTEVTFTAVGRTGFGFEGWTGALAGLDNPVNRVVTAPLEAGARFRVTYGFSDAPTFVEVEAAASTEVVFEVDDANEPVEWTLAAGALPEGLELVAGEGVIRGASLEEGTFPVTVRARDAIGLEANAAVTLEVTAARIPVATLGAPFLLGATGPTPAQRTYLDRRGNGDGSYDLGDFRSFFLAHPDLPAAAVAPGVARTVVPLPDLVPRKEEQP